MNVPAINPRYRVEVVETRAVFLIAEENVEVLTAPIYRQLIPLIDGQRTEREIVRMLQADFPLPNIYYALYQMQDRHFIIEQTNGVSPAEQGFWMVSTERPDWHEKLTDSIVTLAAVGDIPVDALEAILAGLNITTGPDGVLQVVVVDDYANPMLQDINQQTLAEGRSWMLIRPVGENLAIGPILIPGETGCWQCLYQRLHMNRRPETMIQQELDGDDPVYAPGVSIPLSRQMAFDMAALEIARHLSGGKNLVGQIVTLGISTLETRRHTLSRRPQCPACGSPTLPEPEPIMLHSTPKRFTSDGGHRTQNPEQFLQAYQQHISPITGLFPAFHEYESTDQLHVYAAGYNHAMVHGLADYGRGFVRRYSMGKGNSARQGQASALAEAIERYSGIRQGEEYTITASYRELGDRAIHPNDCMLYSEAQYQHPDWETESHQRVPPPFDEQAIMAWSPVWSLTQQRMRYLPTTYCYYDNEPSTSPSDSNGAAAGATLEEAILQGSCELVERDCVAIWWYNRLRRPGVDLNSFASPYLDQLQHFYQTQGREVWALDVTHDLGLPAFVGFSRYTEALPTGGEGILLGCGCHRDPLIALTRALNEMNQMYAVFQDFPVDKKQEYRHLMDDSMEWFLYETGDQHPYVLPHPNLPPTSYADFNYQPTDDILDDIIHFQALVEGKGLEMLVLDQTRPDIGLPVVKVFVPGLRHLWRRLAPGRLYDVPVNLGWLPAPLSEDEMNPITMFL